MTARTLLLILALCAPSAYSQQATPWWENPVGYGLTLSEQQWDRVKRILAESRDRIDQERAEVERAELEMETFFNAEKIEWPRAKQAVDQLAKARAALTQDVTLMMLRMRTVLSVDQWRTLQARGATGRLKGGRGRSPGGDRRE